MFSQSDSFAGVDLDHCVDPDGTIQPWAARILNQIDTYSEISPSGTGVKAFLKGKLPAAGHKKTGFGKARDGAIELYDAGRYFTVTGQHVAGTPATVEERGEQLLALHKELFPPTTPAPANTPVSPVQPGLSEPSSGVGFQGTDEELILKIESSKQGDKFKRLWQGDTSLHNNDDSAADLALCSTLAFWCGPDGGKRIDRLFRQSKLFRAKWDEKHGARTYGNMTIAKALEGRTEFYMPAASSQASEEDQTDLGNALRFAKQHRGKALYCPARNSWLVWDGKRWAEDDLLRVELLAQKTAQSIETEASKVEDMDKRLKLMKFAKHSQSHPRIKAMLELAKSRMSVDPTAFDQNPWLMTVNNGTLDLITGQLLPHDPTHLITRLAPVDYDPQAQAPRWTAFLEQIFVQPGLIGFVRRIAGYLLTGSTREEVLPILYGEGANGKTTLVNMLMAMMGDYACPAPPNLLMKRKNGDLPLSDLATLQGQRLVSASESEATDVLSEGLVKMLTGGDKIKARRLYEMHFDFIPTCKILLQTNHTPNVAGTDVGIWRRLLLIPFTVTIPEKERDLKLQEKLKAELPGILAWAVQGCLDWQKDGLNPPAIVRDATNDYAKESNSVKQFVETCCRMQPNACTPKGVFYEAYSEFCKDAAGEYPKSKKSVASVLKALGCVDKRTASSRGWGGIKLLDDFGKFDRCDGLDSDTCEGTVERTTITQFANQMYVMNPAEGGHVN